MEIINGYIVQLFSGLRFCLSDLVGTAIMTMVILLIVVVELAVNLKKYNKTLLNLAISGYFFAGRYPTR